MRRMEPKKERTSSQAKGKLRRRRRVSSPHFFPFPKRPSFLRKSFVLMRSVEKMWQSLVEMGIAEERGGGGGGTASSPFFLAIPSLLSPLSSSSHLFPANWIDPSLLLPPSFPLSLTLPMSAYISRREEKRQKGESGKDASYIYATLQRRGKDACVLCHFNLGISISLSLSEKTRGVKNVLKSLQ